MPDALKPCPFCGHVGLDFDWGSTHRWIEASCGGCGATTGDQRIQTSGLGTHDEWLAAAKRDAITAWNRRALPAPAGEPEMPGHPEPHTMRWTELEVRAISKYGQAMAEHARGVAMEEAAKLIESLRDDHCAATNDPDSKIAGCEPDGNMCDFVTAWNDSIQAIRAAAPPQGEQT